MLGRVLLVVGGALALGGCATIPKPLVGNYAPVSLASARSGEAAGNRVRWGGEIVKTDPLEEKTCFFVLAEPLDSQARPKTDANSMGRFVACKSGFYDPEVFSKGRELTVTGNLAGTVQHKIGKYDYTYPMIRADRVYLWPERPHYRNRYRRSVPVYDPFWAGMWGWGYNPWWYYTPTQVIVVPRTEPPKDKPKQ